jgi:hypothetical protein
MLSGRGTVIIYSHLLRKWDYTISGRLPFFAGKHISLRTFLPPLGAAFVTGSCPLILSSSGFMLNPYEGRYKADGKNYINFSEIKTVSVSGSALLINGRNFCKMHSELEALRWKDKIVSIAKFSSDRRGEAISEIIRPMFDLERVEKLIKKISGEIKPLRITVNLLYIFLFIAAPAAVLIFTFEIILFSLLITMVFLHALAVYFFYKGYTAVFEERSTPWPVLISIALYPPALIRSIDYFYKDSVLEFNPSAVSMILFNSGNSRKLISFLIREYTFFRFKSENRIEEEIICSFKKTMLNEIKLLLEKCSIDYNELLVPPAPFENIESYCPRCFCQYTGGVRICEDCSIELEKY